MVPAVFFVTPGGLRDRGGIGRLVSSVARTWPAIEPSVPLRIIDPYGPAILAIAPFYFARALAQIVWHAYRREILVVHIHMASRGSVLRKGLIARLVRRFGVPVVVHLHGPDFDVFYRRLPAIAQRWVRRALISCTVVVLGEYWRNTLTPLIGLDPSRVRVLVNGAEAPREVTRRAAKGPCQILFLGRLDASKGLFDLFDALTDERVAKLGWHVKAAGTGSVEKARAYAHAKGLAGRVHITGWVPETDARALMAESDIFVLPSYQEGLSMAVLEALAFGLAVVSTRVGATAEAVIDGESGLLVPAGDVPALAGALTRVIADDDLRARLQAGARTQFQARFDIGDHCRGLAAMYRELARSAS